jgi:flagellar protein FlaJ
VPLNRYQRFAYRLLGPRVDRSAKSNTHLRLSLQKAHIYLRPSVYLSYSYLNILLITVPLLLIVVLLGLLDLVGVINLSFTFFAFMLPLPFFLAFVIYLVTQVMPDLRASGRAKDIDAKLPYALNYISTMASAGVTPERIFESLSKQEIYGEVANEAAWISRDIKLLGKDLIGALSSAIDRSPSIRFQDLLQGAITALSSGENLKDFFLAKSQQYVYENRQDQRQFLESLGILAESYITIVVAAPVFLIVMLSVMLMFGGNGENMLAIGYVLILVLLPMAQVGFGAAIKSVTPEV